MSARKFYIGFCSLDDSVIDIVVKNPHCLEYFCTLHKFSDCTGCYYDYVNRRLRDPNGPLGKAYKNKGVDDEVLTDFIRSGAYRRPKRGSRGCRKECDGQGFLYPIDSLGHPISDIDSLKGFDNFYRDKLVTRLGEVPYRLNYETTDPKPKTVVHFGQLKMFLVTLIYLLEVIDDIDEEVHIVYPGSARGDNILILCDLFPGTRWYLIDPNDFDSRLHVHKQIIDIKNEFFTDSMAESYHDKLANKRVLFISDIRLDTDDKSVLKDQENNANWYRLTGAESAYLKFRCPYFHDGPYRYYDGDLMIQPYAPLSSTESRILIQGKLKDMEYNIEEYQGKFMYFNRVLRPSHYSDEGVAKTNAEYLDHCWDCIYFRSLIAKYNKKYSRTSTPLDVDDILKRITKHVTNKIAIKYQNIRDLIQRKRARV